MNIGARIRALREERGLSLFDLSVKAYVPEQTLRSWESGRKVPSSVEFLARVADVLDTTTDYLITGAEPCGAARHD